MDHPAFKNSLSSALYFAIWTLASCALAAVIAPLTSYSISEILLFGATFGYLFGFITLFLWSVVKYGDYTKQRVFQRIISYVALGLLTVSFWLGFGFLLFYIELPTKNIFPFFNTIPLLAAFGVLIYIIVVQKYTFLLKKIETIEEENREEKVFEEEEENSQQEVKELLERVTVKFGQKIEVIPVSEILYVQAEGDYVMIFTANGHHLKEQTMKYFEEHLPELQFVRVHRSFIVNVEVISRIELYEKQNQLITLQNGKQIKVSAAGYKLLKKILNL
jgi:hypothetical protein